MLEVQVTHGGAVGRGESEPHEHDVRVTDGAARELLAMDRGCWDHLDPVRMNGLIPRSALRTALDCALWDLRAKREGRRIWEILDLGIDPDASYPIFETLSLGSPERMAAAAVAARAAPGLKIKLGHPDGRDADRLEAIRAAVPGITLTIDANEGWTPEMLRRMLPLAARCDVALIEQPVPAAIADELCLSQKKLDQFNEVLGHMETELESLEVHLVADENTYTNVDKSPL